MRINWLQIAAFLFLFVLGSTLQAQERKPAKYIVSTESWVPYWIVDEAQISGLLNDIMLEIDRRIPIPLSPIKPVPIKRAKIGFINGDIDIECCVSKIWRNTEDEMAVTLWSDTVMMAEEILIFPNGLTFPFEKLSDLKRKHLATILGYGYAGEEYFIRNDVYKNVSLIKMVAAGRVDGAIIDRYEYLHAIKHFEELKGLSEDIEMGPVINRSELKMRIHKSRPDLFQVISKTILDMKTDGTIDKIFDNYTNSIEP